jgi:hypothetical protein
MLLSWPYTSHRDQPPGSVLAPPGRRCPVGSRTSSHEVVRPSSALNPENRLPGISSDRTAPVGKVLLSSGACRPKATRSRPELHDSSCPATARQPTNRLSFMGAATGREATFRGRTAPWERSDGRLPRHRRNETVASDHRDSPARGGTEAPPLPRGRTVQPRRPKAMRSNDLSLRSTSAVRRPPRSLVASRPQQRAAPEGTERRVGHPGGRGFRSASGSPRTRRTGTFRPHPEGRDRSVSAVRSVDLPLRPASRRTRSRAVGRPAARITEPKRCSVGHPMVPELLVRQPKSPPSRLRNRVPTVRRLSEESSRSGCPGRPDSSSRAPTPASLRLRRFPRPWRFTPLRARPAFFIRSRS